MSPFEVLGLPETASPDEVKARWRSLCKVHHPDWGGNAVEFDEVRRAYKEAYARASEPVPCSECSGKGKTKQSRGFNSIDMTCAACGGSGRKEMNK